MSIKKIATVRQPATRLLVVSENGELSAHIKAVIDNLSFDHPLTVHFCYTTLNKSPAQMIALGATEIDMKEPSTVERVLREHDLVFSLHCKQIFPRRLVEGVCCINFHPGLNPFNRGWFPQAFSIVNGLPSGATIHLMDADVDHGNILAQQEVAIEPSDTSLEVYRKVIEAEKQLIETHLFNIVEGAFETTRPSSEGNYNGIKDYRAMCALDLEAVGTLGDHLNLLRATTHGEFRNAYFYDDDGKKYFVRISIDPDDAS